MTAWLAKEKNRESDPTSTEKRKSVVDFKSLTRGSLVLYVSALRQ
jgi:hypothetical protein